MVASELYYDLIDLGNSSQDTQEAHNKIIDEHEGSIYEVLAKFVLSKREFENKNYNLSKEYLEVFCSGKTAIIDDFKKLTLAGKKVQHFKAEQDKGYENEIAAFSNAITSGGFTPIEADQLFLSSLASFKALESIKKGGEKIHLSLN